MVSCPFLFISLIVSILSFLASIYIYIISCIFYSILFVVSSVIFCCVLLLFILTSLLMVIIHVVLFLPCFASGENSCRGDKEYNIYKPPQVGSRPQIPPTQIAQYVDLHYYVDKELMASIISLPFFLFSLPFSLNCVHGCVVTILNLSSEFKSVTTVDTSQCVKLDIQGRM